MLIQAVQTDGATWAGQLTLLQYLIMMRSPAWKSSRSHWKHEAEDTLIRPLDTQAKANAIARIIYSWFTDPAREVPFEEKGLPSLDSPQP